MFLFPSLCFGSNQTPEHSEGTGSCDVIRHSEGVQDQHRDNHRNSIMRYHEGNRRGLIPHPATVTILCLKAGVRGDWEAEEEVPLTSPLLLTGVSKGPRNQKKKGVLIKTGEEASAAREEEVNIEAPPDSHNFTFADTVGQDDRSPVDFSPHARQNIQRTGRKF